MSKNSIKSTRPTQPNKTTQTTQPTQTTPPTQTIQSIQPTEYTPFSHILPRIYWMGIGPAIFVLLSVREIIDSKQVVFFSIILWLIVISMIVCRYIDIRYLNGLTSEGKPATLNDWRKYSLFLSLLAATIWAIVLFMHFFI